MKTTISLFLLLVTFCSFATVRTVSNNASRPAQFDTFNAAQTASAAGDTIYIHGSPFVYPALIITKLLVIIGAGYKPNNQYGHPTTVGNIEFFNDSGLPDPSGSVLTGLNGGIVSSIGTVRSNNIRIFRCKLTSVYLYAPSSTYADNWVLYNNILAQAYGATGSRTSAGTTNIIIANNIITGQVLGLTSSSIVVDHNIMISSNNISSAFNLIFTNNIFSQLQ